MALVWIFKQVFSKKMSNFKSAFLKNAQKLEKI